MNRSHSTIYRICLLAVIILTITGGIFYYMNYVADRNTVTEGTLVRVWNQKTEVPEAEEIKRTEVKAELSETEGTETEEADLSEETSVESFKPYAGEIECA